MPTIINQPGGTATLPAFGQGLTGVGASGGTAQAQGPAIPQPTVSSTAVTLSDPPAIGPAPYAMDIDGEFNASLEVTAFALNRAQNADKFVNALTTLAANLVPQAVVPQFPALGTQPALSSPTAPVIVVPTYNPPEVPAAFNEQLSLSAEFPTFGQSPPRLAFPNAPIAPSIVLPDAPGVDLNFTYPTVDVELPDAPPLLSIDVQPFKGVDFPTLSATAPVLTAVPPSIVNYIPAAPYTDTLLDTLKLTLQQRLDIGNTGKNTGLPPAVEQGIWNRGREREYRQQADAIKALDRMEGMGYALPSGAWVDARIKIQTDSMATIAGNSRDVAAEQAKLEQENIKTALTMTQEIEAKLLDYANQTEQRRFEATKYATEAGVAIYNGLVQGYTAMVSAYRAQIDVYTAQINGARAEVEVYQAQIAAEKLKVDANAVIIQSYKVRVDAALASIQVFEGEIALVKTRAEVEQIKVSIFGEEVRAYASKAQLFSTQVEAYKAGIEAQTAIQATYATSAQVYSTLVAATSKEIDSNLDLYKTKLAAKTQEVETFKALVSSEAERVRSIAAADTATTAIYSAQVQAQSSLNSALIEEYKTWAQVAEQYAQIGVSAAEANGKLYIAAAGVAADAAKVGAQVEAQLGASALGAVTFATHKSRQDSLGFSLSSSYGQSKSTSQSHGTSESAGTSVSYSTSTSVSASTSASESYATNTNIAEAQ